MYRALPRTASPLTVSGRVNPHLPNLLLNNTLTYTDQGRIQMAKKKMLWFELISFLRESVLSGAGT